MYEYTRDRLQKWHIKRGKSEKEKEKRAVTTRREKPLLWLYNRHKNNQELKLHTYLTL